MIALFAPAVRKHVRSYERISIVLATLVVIGVVTAGFMVVSGRAEGLRFHWPARVTKIFTSKTTARTTPAPRTVSQQPLAPLAVDQFFAGDGSALSASKWAATNAGPFTSAFTTGNTANFSIVNGTGTGGTISVGGINSTENFTITAPSGTLGGTAAAISPITVSSGKTFDAGTQGWSTGATVGFSLTGPGAFRTSGGTFAGGFVLNSGTLVAGGVNAMGAASSLTINGGTIAGSATQNFTGKYTSGITVAGNFQLGALTTDVPLSLSAANLTFSNNMALGAATRTITIGGNGTYTLGGILSGNSGTGLTVANASGAGGRLALTAANTYTGNTTINGGTLSLSGSGSIANSPTIEIAGGGAIFDVSLLTSALTLAGGQTLKASGATATSFIITATGKGLTTAANNPLQFTAFNGVTPPLTISSGTGGSLALQSTNPVTVTISNGGTPLGVGDYKLIAKAGNGAVSGTVGVPTVNGDGVAAGTAGTLVITSGELFLHVAAALTGTKTVGAGGNYTTLTAAIADYNSKGVGGPVVFSLTDASYGSETYPITIGTAPGNSATNTLTIKPANGVSPTFSATVGSNNPLIDFKGASNVIIDGSNTSGGTTRNLTFSNLNTATGSPTVRFITSANSNVVENSVIKGVGDANGGIVFLTGAVSPGTINLNTIQNCTITASVAGFFPAGVVLTGQNNATQSGNTITGNDFTQLSVGVEFMWFYTNTTISNNSFFDTTPTANNGKIAINVGVIGPVGTCNITRNRIYDLKSSVAADISGIVMSTHSGDTITVTNNSVALDLLTNQGGHGIQAFIGTAGGVANVYHNSFRMSGATGSTANTYGAEIYAPANFRNNAILNLRSSSGGFKSYGISVDSSQLASITSDFNDILASGAGGVFGFDLSADRATLAAWQTATSKDANSESVDPQFASATDLHITRTSPGVLSPVENAGISIGGITTDFDGDTRTNPPDIGADEVTTIQFSAAPNSVLENVVGGLATITVARTAGTANAATVNYATSNGTATGGASCGGATDYQNASGALNFAAGDASKTFTVSICPDSTLEPDETVNLTLSSATGSIIGTPNTAVLTITNDDAQDVTFNSSGSLAAGTYNNITVNSPSVVTVTGNVVVNGCVNVNGGTLNMGGFTFTGTGCFTVSSGATLDIGSAAGITTGATGNVQVGGPRTFSNGANYIYNGASNQAVGNALPGSVANLTIANTGGAGNNTVTGNVGQIVTGLLEVSSGVYFSASDYADVDIAAAGTLSLANNITVSGNWSNAGTFIPNGFGVTFDGATGQTITGNTTFYDLTKTVAAAQQFNFAAGSLTTVTHSLTFNGATGQLLTLRSTVNGTQWNLHAPTTQSVDYVDVKDSNASGGAAAVTATHSVNSGNNVNWTFVQASIVYVDPTFTGAPGTDPDGVGLATSIGYDAFATVQAGIDGVAASGTVNVAAGTFSEQLLIGKSLTLVGAGAGVTNISAPAIVAAGFSGFHILVDINNAAIVEASGITVKGPLNLNGCPGPQRRYYGVYVRGAATLNLHDSSVLDIRENNPAPATQCVLGTAVDAGSSVAAPHQVGTLTLHNTTITGFQARAVTVDNAGTSATITNNTLTGSTSPNSQQTVLLISIGASANISGNTIGGAQCNDAVNCGPDTFTQGAACGISLTVPANGTQVTNNTISNNDYGINYFAAPGDTSIISGNTLTANRYFGVNISEGNLTVNNNTFSGTSNVAIVAASVNDPGNHTASNSSGTITGNTITGATVALQLLDQTAFPPDAFVPQLTAHFNRIVAATAIDNPQNQASDMENNWWGCNAGPGFAGCGTVTGTGVDFDPWIQLRGSATPNTITPPATSSVAADMTQNSDSMVPSGTLPNIPDSYSATNGTMNPTTGTISGGAASSIFTSSNNTNALATITVDNQNVNVPITVTAPTAAPARISGNVTTADGRPLAGVTVNLSGGHSGGRTITDGNGQYHFDNVETNGFYLVTPGLSNFSFSPASRGFALLADKIDAVFTGTAVTPDANPLESPEFFVRQQYLDFLNREPDQAGLAYWSAQLRACGADLNCTKARKITVSAAFFMSEEFQQSGNYIYRIYQAGLGRRLTYEEFRIAHDYVIGGTDLDSSKAAFTESFVERPEFVARYQQDTEAETFVDAVVQNVLADIELDLSSQREALISGYNFGSNLKQSRSLVMQRIVNNSQYQAATYNRGFVQMEYFGYLRRDAEIDGFNFWVNILDHSVPGNYRGMVCSFTTSAEYQRRFSPVVVHSNSECGN